MKAVDRPCATLACPDPRATGQSYCRRHANERARLSYHGAPRRWREFLICLCLTATYRSGYRAGTGDKAAELLEQRAASREERELQAQREHAGIYGTYYRDPAGSVGQVRSASGMRASPLLGR